MNWRLVVVAVVEKDDFILFGEKRKDIGPYPNTIHIPGGGMNPENETAEEAVRREVREEAGIEIKDIEKIDFDEDYEQNKHGELTHYVYLIYKARYSSGDLSAKDDLQKVRWVKKSEIKKLNLSRPSVKLFRTLGYF